MIAGSGFKTHAARHDGRMHSHIACEVHHVHRCGALTKAAGVPRISGDQCLLRPLVGLPFARILGGSPGATKRLVVEKRPGVVVVHVAPYVCQLVQKAEPEVVYAIVPEGQSHHGGPVGELQRCAIQVCARQVFQSHERDSEFGQAGCGAAGTISQRTHPCQFGQNIRGDAAGSEIGLRSVRVRDRHRPPTPGLQRVSIGLGVRPEARLPKHHGAAGPDAGALHKPLHDLLGVVIQ